MKNCVLKLLLFTALLHCSSFVEADEHASNAPPRKNRNFIANHREKKDMAKKEAAKYLELRRQGFDEVSNTKEAAAMRDYKLRKKKRKGILRKKQSSLANVLFPGVSPEDYSPSETIYPITDFVHSKKTNIPFEFYDLPICQQRKMVKIRKNLGTRLQGMSPKPAPFEMNIKQSHGCSPLCIVNIHGKKIRWLRKLVERQYRVLMSLDQLPVLMRSKELNYAVRGYPVGFKAPPAYTGLNHEEYYLYNHLAFTVTYQEDPSEYEGVRITGFDVHPVSVSHKIDDTLKPKAGSFQRSLQEDEFIKTCNSPNAEEVINDPSSYLALRLGPTGEDLSVAYTYSVDWQESDLSWSDRWDVYVIGSTDDDVHFFAIVNSLMIVLFLTGAIATIIIRTLKQDIAGYNEMHTLEEAQEETGWKLVHGDVFRPPQNQPMLFSVLVGTGAQIGAALLLSLLLSITKFINPLKKGQTLTSIIVLYVLCGSVAGFVSARLYKFSDEKAWKMNTIMTATLLPGCMVSIFMVLNVWLSFAGAATAVSFFTILSLFALWVCISTPLVFVGSFFGLKVSKIEVPTKTNQIARFIPEGPWYSSQPLSFFLGGILPFGSVCIELFFIMSAIWLHQIYYVMGFLLAVMLILAATCAEVAVVMCYLQLCVEDHRWYWKAFFNTATSGLYLFLYTLWFLVSRLELVGVLPVVVYLTYMAMMSICFGLFCGSVGVLTCFWFTRTIYGALKVD